VSATRPNGRILWVTEEPPDRSLGGGSIRQAHLFEALAGALPTDLLLAGRLEDERVRAAAASVTVVPNRRAFWSEHPIGRRALELGIVMASPLPSAAYPAGPTRRALKRALAARARAYELVCVEHAVLAPLVRACGGRPAALTLHHLLSGMLRQQLRQTPGRRQRWFQRRDLKKAVVLEGRAVRDYTRVFTCSEEDRGQLIGLAPDSAARLRVIPNGVDLSAFPERPIPDEPLVLFPGSLAYGPNVDGVRWFCTEVWPRVHAHRPDAALLLAGRNPAPEVSSLAGRSGVQVRANVPSMADCFLSARAVVVPLRVGTGTRLKALEAMAARRPLIGTTVGLEGLNIIDGRHALVRDDPGAMADAIRAVLDRDDFAAELAAAGRAHVEQKFSWDRIGSHYLDEIAAMLRRN
jgi:glycosyltransferase involved in cell wall biosynthesis